MKTRASSVPLRGQVYEVQVRDAGRKPFVIVSNNRRNRSLPTVLAVRVTSAPKPRLRSIVEIPPGEPVQGRVLCDDIALIPSAILGRSLGALSRSAVRAVEHGLLAALDIER